MSAQVYISGGRLITAGGAVFGIPAAGPPPPPSGEENVVKFRSGMYMQSGNPNDQASMNAFSTSWAGNGGKCVGYSAWYKWNLVETALGVYSFTPVFNDYAYLQSVAPGASFVPQFNWYSNQTLANSNLPSFNPQSDGVPNYIINNPSTYGAGPPTSSSSYGGWCCDSYESPNYNYVRAAYWRTLIQARIVALFNAFGSTIVPDGQGFTVDEHPLFEMVGTSTPTDLDMQAAPNIAADYTYELANQAWLNMLPSLRATMPHTGVFIMPGFGANNFSGGNDPTQQNTLIKAMLTNGIAQSCTDVYTPTQLTYAQNYLVGNNYNGSTGFQTPLLGQIDSTPSVQGDDYPLNTITEILNCSFVTLQASRVFLYSQSSANFNIPGFWNTIIGTINSYSIPTICGELPTMYMIAPQNFVAASTTASSVTLTWTPQTTQTGTNLVYKIYRNGSLINTTASTSVATYTDTGLSANTQYTYTIILSNANGVGPQSTYIATTAVFSFPSFSTADSTYINTSQAAASLTGSVLQVCVGNGHFAGGAWYRTQQNIQTFTNNFTFQMPGPISVSNIGGCLSFGVQNSNLTTNPNYEGGTNDGIYASTDANLGGFGAYSNEVDTLPAVGNSVFAKLDLAANNNSDSCYNTNGAGGPNQTGLYTNGGPYGALLCSNDLNPYGINLYSGHIFAVSDVYDGTLWTRVIKDTVSGAQARFTWPVAVPLYIDATASPTTNLAWIGFTAGSVGTGSPQSNVLSWSFSTGYNPRLATLAMSPAAGEYASTQTVTISGPGTIYYTTNGLAPTSSSTLYTGPVTVSANTVLQAVAIQAGYTDSLLAIANYQISTANPINFPSGFAANDGAILNGYAHLNGSAIQLTDTTGPAAPGNGNGPGTFQASSAWYASPVSISNFATQFTAMFSNSTASGQYGVGMCFVIQNQPSSSANPLQLGLISGGPSALGASSKSFGYGYPTTTLTGTTGGLLSSIAISFNLSNNGVGLYQNGALPTGSDTVLTGVTLSAGNPITAAFSYNGTTLMLVLTDTVTHGTQTVNWTVNIPSAVGASTAYLGFTGASSYWRANQSISNWTCS